MLQRDPQAQTGSRHAYPPGVKTLRLTGSFTVPGSVYRVRVQSLDRLGFFFDAPVSGRHPRKRRSAILGGWGKGSYWGERVYFSLEEINVCWD